MKLLMENWRKYLLEYSYPDGEQKPITWVAPDWSYEQWELFAKGVQLFSEGEFEGILEPNVELGGIPSEVEKIYNDLAPNSVFQEFSKGQTVSANCVAGQAFYEAVTSGKLVSISLQKLSKSIVNLPFDGLSLIPSSEIEREQKVQQAHELINKGNSPGEVRDLEKIAIALWKNNPSMPAPMIYEKRNGDLFLLGGRTRLAACFALEIDPQVWLVTRKPLGSIVKQYLQEWQ